MQKINKTMKAFSLIEVLLSVTIISILISIGTSVYFSQFQQNQNFNTIFLVKKNLVNARLSAQNQKYNLQHGVYITTSEITLFSGSSYATRNTAYDYTTSIVGIKNLSGDTEIVFSKMYGTLSGTKNISINFQNGKSAVITLNRLGVVN